MSEKKKQRKRDLMLIDEKWINAGMEQKLKVLIKTIKIN